MTMTENGAEDLDRIFLQSANKVFIANINEVALSQILDSLYSDGMIVHEEMSTINSEKVVHKNNRKLLSIMTHKTPKHRRSLIDLLKKEHTDVYEEMQKAANLKKNGPQQSRLGSLSDWEEYAREHLEDIIQQLTNEIGDKRIKQLEDELKNRQLKKDWNCSDSMANEIFSNEELEAYLYKEASARRSCTFPTKKAFEILFVKKAVSNKGGTLMRQKTSDNGMGSSEGGRLDSGISDGSASHSDLPDMAAGGNEGGTSVQNESISQEEVFGENNPSETTINYCSSIPQRRKYSGPNKKNIKKQKLEGMQLVQTYIEKNNITYTNLHMINNKQHNIYRCLTAHECYVFCDTNREKNVILTTETASVLKKSGGFTKPYAFKLQYNMGVLGNIARTDVLLDENNVNKCQYRKSYFMMFIDYFEEFVKDVLIPVLAVFLKVQKKSLLKMEAE
ncbi:uncharacterized protein LOC117963043 [Acipenser ruthenus]|uniref:uncharacterized protein LOC117963043 n=1 Tax=Acipenser ruthenus TaxID=7906 RepID=UPI002740F11A|nr:uncharacterized protein LOC117963043 [Acipenser ruthenus]